MKVRITFDALSPGNSVKLFVTNANLVWVDTTLSGQKVVAIVEQ